MNHRHFLITVLLCAVFVENVLTIVDPHKTAVKQPFRQAYALPTIHDQYSQVAMFKSHAPPPDQESPPIQQSTFNQLGNVRNFDKQSSRSIDRDEYGPFDVGGNSGVDNGLNELYEDHGVECPALSTGQYPYLMDCRQFLNCWKGRGHIQSCAPGTLFNPISRECDHPSKVQCISYDNPKVRVGRVQMHRGQSQHGQYNADVAAYEQNVQAISPQCEPESSGLFPHPENCFQFLNCDHGNTFVQDCGPGTVFNPIHSICDWPYNVDCGERPQYSPNNDLNLESYNGISQPSAHEINQNLYNQESNTRNQYSGVLQPNFAASAPYPDLSGQYSGSAGQYSPSNTGRGFQNRPSTPYGGEGSLDERIDLPGGPGTRPQRTGQNSWQTTTIRQGSRDQQSTTTARPNWGWVNLSRPSGQSFSTNSVNTNHRNSWQTTSRAPTNRHQQSATATYPSWGWINPNGPSERPPSNSGPNANRRAGPSSTNINTGIDFYDEEDYDESRDLEPVSVQRQTHPSFFQSSFSPKPTPDPHSYPIYYRPTATSTTTTTTMTPAPTTRATTEHSSPNVQRIFNKQYYSQDKPNVQKDTESALPLSEAIKHLLRPYLGTKTENMTAGSTEVKQIENKLVGMANKQSIRLVASTDPERSQTETNQEMPKISGATLVASGSDNVQSHQHPWNAGGQQGGHYSHHDRHNPHFHNYPSRQLHGNLHNHSPHNHHHQQHHQHHHHHHNHQPNDSRDSPILSISPQSNNLLPLTPTTFTTTTTDSPIYDIDLRYSVDANASSRKPSQSPVSATSDVSNESQSTNHRNTLANQPTRSTTPSAQCYPCNNGNCVPLEKICDGRNDCGNREDEMSCDHVGYEIKLVTPENGKPNEGRVEVKVFGEWGFVCDDKFGMRDADVVCKELGFPLGASAVRGNSFYPPAADRLKNGNAKFAMDELDCLGNETSLRECDFKGWGLHDCNFEEVVGVVCKIPVMSCLPDYWLCETSLECIPISFLCDEVKDCADHSDENLQFCEAPEEYRLSGGNSELEGRVEVKYHGVWGTICDDEFGSREAATVCTSLGFYGPAAVMKKTYAPGSGQIWLDQVSCIGNESNVGECSHWKWGEHNCQHTEDVGIRCSHGIKRNRTPTTLSPAHKLRLQRTQLMNAAAKEPSVHQVERSSRFQGGQCGQIKVDDSIDAASEEQEAMFRVIHGSSARKGHHPWQATVRVKSQGKSSHWCGAVLISDRHVLTAAHCLVGFAKGAYFVRLGDHHANVVEPTEVEMYIETMYIHPDFRKGQHMNNDIAVVKLKAPVRFTDYIQPICLPPKNATYVVGTNCTISGWGSIQSGEATPSNILRAGRVPILPVDVCRQPQVYGDVITEGMFCAGSLDEGIDACDGDSGGPMVCDRNGDQTLFGIISWGQHCGYANKPGVYVKVTHYIEWIKEQIK